MDYRRFAIYIAPEPGDLADFGANWLGWDAARGEECTHFPLPGLPLPVADITRTPRKYGFHGTIKPPFRLVRGSSLGALHADMMALAGQAAPIALEGLQLSRLGGFLALTPRGDTAPLSALAARVVQALDHHRAPASDEELARRRAHGLSDRQEANLITWGYPYVMEDFRFHMTLTGRLPDPARNAVQAALAPVIAPLLPSPFPIPSLCLFGEGEDGRFRIVHRYTLSG